MRATCSSTGPASISDPGEVASVGVAGRECLSTTPGLEWFIEN